MKKLQLLLLITLIFSTVLSAQPTISSFVPTNGPVGTSVTITGTNFDTTPANNIVFFGATQATVTTASATELMVAVPIGATYVPISVLVNELIAYSSSQFIVTFDAVTIDASSFNDKVDLTTGAFPTSVSVGDLDGDGMADLAMVNASSNSVSIFRNTGMSGAMSYASKMDLALPASPNSVAIGDLDGDGKPDLAVTWASSSVSVFRNTSTVGSISYAGGVDYTVGVTPFEVSIGDLDGDGKADLVIANYSSQSVSVLRNISAGSGSISYDTKVDFTTGTQPISVSIADLDGDGKPDLVSTNNASNTVSVLRNMSTVGTISYAAKVDYATGLFNFSVAVGDLDDDGKADLAVANRNSNSISVYKNTSTIGSISYNAKVDYTTGTNPLSVAIGDIDGDGKPDLATANYSSGGTSVFRNTGTAGTIDAGSFASKVDFVTGTNPTSVAIGDFDGDGTVDLAVSNGSSNNVSLLSMISSSIETDITAFSFPEQTGEASIDATNHTVDIEVEFGTDVTSLVSNFTLSTGANAEVNAAAQTSATTSNDFTSPVTYTITAEDGVTTQDWLISVTILGQIAISNGSATTCNATFKDSGADGDYSNDEDFIFTFSPELSTDKVMISFTSFDVENGFDNLFVYNGSTTGSVLIATLTGTSIPSDITASGAGGELTFQFVTDGSAVRAGWEASISCVTLLPNTETDITAFSFAEQTGAATIDATNHTVDIEVVFGTDVTSLVSTFSLSTGASAEVNAAAQTSATTANDFTSPVTYTITAEDGVTTQDWEVSIKEVIVMSNGSATTCETTFKDSGIDGDYSNNEDFTYTFSPETATDKIMISFTSFDVENGFDNLFVYDGPTTGSVLIATLTGTSIPSDITASGSGGELTLNFVSDGSFVYSGWEASVACVTLAPNTETEITAFSFAEQTGAATIDATNHTVDIEVVFGTDVTSLVSTFTLSTGASAEVNAAAQTSATTSNDFTSPVSYTITAEDGVTTQDWLISVTISDQIVISNGSATTCEATFKDSGVDGDYSNDENFTYTFSPESSSDKIKVTFTSFELEPGFDNLFVYDGPTIGSPLVATLTGSELPSFIVATEAGGELTFRFVTDGSGTFSGWEASITCEEALNTATDITDFSFAEQSGSVVIDAENHTVGIGVTTGTDLSALVSTFTLSSGATAQVNGEQQVSGATANNFNSSVVYTITAENGFTSQDWVVNVSIGPVGLADDLYNIDVSYYPNPVTNKLNINKGQNRELGIQLIDVSGKLMYSTTTQKQLTTVDLRALKPGIFLLRLSNGSKEVTQRILKN